MTTMATKLPESAVKDAAGAAVQTADRLRELAFYLDKTSRPPSVVEFRRKYHLLAVQGGEDAEQQKLTLIEDTIKTFADYVNGSAESIDETAEFPATVNIKFNGGRDMNAAAILDCECKGVRELDKTNIASARKIADKIGK